VRRPCESLAYNSIIDGRSSNDESLVSGDLAWDREGLPPIGGTTMSTQLTRDATPEQVWRHVFTEGDLDTRLRRIFRLLPREPRCVQCFAPFKGIGAALVRLIWDKRPSRMNPRICNDCEVFARKHPGGAEVELAMLFVDIRGSTGLAERLGALAFSRLIERFYNAAADVLIDSDALIEKLVGDEVVALYCPGFAGPQYTRRAIEAAERLLTVTGHGRRQGPWVPLGVGVHRGTAFVGSVGSKDGLVEITALGDAVNTTARLAAEAKPGEALISDDASSAAGLDTQGLEQHTLSLRGRRQPVDVWVMRVEPR
jgi:adenylate cyclase